MNIPNQLSNSETLPENVPLTAEVPATEVKTTKESLTEVPATGITTKELVTEVPATEITFKSQLKGHQLLRCYKI